MPRDNSPFSWLIALIVLIVLVVLLFELLDRV